MNSKKKIEVYLNGVAVENYEDSQFKYVGDKVDVLGRRYTYLTFDIKNTPASRELLDQWAANKGQNLIYHCGIYYVRATLLPDGAINGETIQVKFLYEGTYEF